MNNNDKYTTAFLHCDWLYFLWHVIKHPIVHVYFHETNFMYSSFNFCLQVVLSWMTTCRQKMLFFFQLITIQQHTAKHSFSESCNKMNISSVVIWRSTFYKKKKEKILYLWIALLWMIHCPRQNALLSHVCRLRSQMGLWEKYYYAPFDITH